MSGYPPTGPGPVPGVTYYGGQQQGNQYQAQPGYGTQVQGGMVQGPPLAAMGGPPPAYPQGQGMPGYQQQTYPPQGAPPTMAPMGGYSQPNVGTGVPPSATQGQAWNPDMGGQVPENDTEGPPTAIPQYEGYQIGSYDQLKPTAPPPPVEQPIGKPPVMEFARGSLLSEEDCHNAMEEFVSQHCCFGKGPARDMRIERCMPSTALHLTLETFTEARNTKYKCEPFYGGGVDGPHNGPAPGPWAIPVRPDSLFNNHEKKLVVPHTDSVAPCNYCWGRGFTRCRHCHGRGRDKCNWCHGSGHTHMHGERQNCNHCHGSGHDRCTWCHGRGIVKCHTCQGYRMLKSFVQLVVSFKNNVSDYILEGTDMPDELVRGVSGITIFEEELPMVWPILTYPIQSINENSRRLVDAHRSCFPNERTLQQRHRLRGVPVTECYYRWKDINSRFWVYGTERKVHCPDYPQKCCCGCSIL